MSATGQVRTSLPSARRLGRAPAGTVESGRSGPILSCRLRVTLPRGDWAREFTSGYPEARVEVLDRLEVSRSRTLLEIRVISSEGRNWGVELRRLQTIQEVELLDRTAGAETYRVVVRGRTFVPLFKRLKMVRHFPFPIQDGVATWTVVAPRAKVRALLNSLEASGVPFSIEAVHHGSVDRAPSTLTPRQKEVLARSLAEGYFDVPRRISLTRLAPKIGVAVSTLSVTLGIIERKLIDPRG